MTTTTTPTTATSPVVDLEAIKAKQQATWASGDFSVIGTTLQPTGESLADAADVAAGWRALDVAAGNGNAALAAGRRGASVTAVDFVPELLERAQARAAAEGLELDTRTADAAALPFGDRTFDLVLSAFGVMFAPEQERVAAELVRVTRPGGRIALASWTRASFIGEMFRVVSAHVPPPAGLPSVFAWGDGERVAELLGSEVTVRQAVTRSFVFRYRSADDFVETFRTYYGPTFRAFAALDEAGQDALEHDLVALADHWNASQHGTLAVPADYLEVVAERC